MLWATSKIILALIGALQNRCGRWIAGDHFGNKPTTNMYPNSMNAFFFGKQFANDSISTPVMMWKFQIKPKELERPNHCSNIDLYWCNITGYSV